MTENVIVMVPFCLSPPEADLVLQVMSDNGLVRDWRLYTSDAADDLH